MSGIIQATNLQVTNVKKLDGSAPTLADLSISHAGTVVGFAKKNVMNCGFSTTSSSLVDVTAADVSGNTRTNDRKWYIDYTPKFSDSILVWETDMFLNDNNNGGYFRFAIVDANNSNAIWDEAQPTGNPSYISAGGYNRDDEGVWYNHHIRGCNVSGTTNTMRLQLRVLITSGTFDNDWSQSDHRVITVTEYKQ